MPDLRAHNTGRISGQERRTRILKAKDALIRAAAALTNDPINDLAFAILETAMALVHLSAADTDESARDRVLAIVRSEQDRRAEVG